MLEHWIWLSIRPGLSDRMKNQVLQHFEDPEEIYSSRFFDTVEGLTPEGREALMDKNLTQAQDILHQCAQKNIKLLTFFDEAYPQRLKNIPDPPVVLYYKGILPKLDEVPAIAVVGTRKASPYGLTMARRMGSQLADCGGAVVSGVASGIDGAAMASAMNAGGAVVGVLGCGADVVYPTSNRALFLDMEKRGCLLTEFPPGTPPHRWNFPKRNRIISGLSCGVLVVEAPEKSGALITARQAAEQGRDLFVLPGNADSPTCWGSNALLRDGGICVSTGWEVLSEYEGMFPGAIRRPETDGRLPVSDEPERVLPMVAQKPRRLTKSRAKKPTKDKKVIDNRENPPYSDVETGPLDDTERAIVELLRQGDRLRDEILAEAGLDAGTVLSALTLMELKGIVKRLPGNRLGLK